ncbi:MAG TPA: winged helix-turn-helix domain-containing protein [Terracidiphilus sp.]|nr:winged helix-turn-helix domain-containing protein [Terracidiphilus sp.]
MAISPTENMVRFGLFELDLRTRQLTRNGVRIRLPQQPLQILSILLESPGEIVMRDELRRRLWPSDVFVDFDHGLNKSIQKLRDALGDSAGSPRYIETIPRIGYRFIAPVNAAAEILEFNSHATLLLSQKVPAPSSGAPIAANRRPQWLLLVACMAGAAACVVLALGATMLYRLRHRSLQIRYTQLTDFTDSAVAPALSPDGHMVAFIRGGYPFLSSDQIYVKMLPNGEARRVTDDHRPKYGLAFSPDGSQIAYTVLEHAEFSTYTVSALGGEPHLLLNNAAGLVWLDPQRLLFSEIRPGEGIHMGVVTATLTGSGLREIYFPAHQRGMAHLSFPSPDRRWALVVEMNGNGDWAPCRLLGLVGQGSPRSVGPADACSSAGWSPDGGWMYFTATVDGQSHIWRQRFPDGTPEQITFGPTEEDGVAMEPSGRALITSVGVRESAIWIHDASGERSLSSEGEVVGELSPPVFSPNAGVLYYLLQREGDSGPQLWRTVVGSGESEAMFPGISMTAFDVSPDGKHVVYTTAESGGTTQLWLAPVDRSVPARKVGISGARSPHFGPRGQILFQQTEGNANYLEQIDPGQSRPSKVFPYPILEFQGVSPSGRWATVAVPRTPEGNFPEMLAIPLDGGASRRICTAYCRPTWSTNGKFLFVPVEEPSRTGAGRSLAIPVGPGESLGDLPAGGIAPLAESGVVRGAQSVGRGELVPGKDPGQYAWVNTLVHRNLYRISLP